MRARAQLVAIERPQQVVVGAEVEGAQYQVALAVIGQQQQRHLPRLHAGAEGGRKAQRLALRQGQADQDQVAGAVRQGLPRRVPGARVVERHAVERQGRRDRRDLGIPLVQQKGAAAVQPRERARRRFQTEAPCSLGAEPPGIEHLLGAQQGAQPREQRHVVDRLGQEVVGTAFQAAHAIVRIGQRGHHHDGDMLGLLQGLEPPAGLEAVHVRHHDVEQDDVRCLGAGERDRLLAAACQRHLVVFAPELGFEQLPVREHVVHDEDMTRHGAPFALAAVFGAPR